jgi:chromosome segregation ATPase
MLENKKTVEKYEFELLGIKKQREVLNRQHIIMTSKGAKMAAQRKSHQIDQDSLKDKITTIEVEYKQLKSDVQSLEKEIDQKMRERKLLNNDVVSAEANERLVKAQKQDLENQQTEQKNKITACQAESNRLSKIIGNLSKEKEKYGVEASQANAKYYLCLEQVKLKNNLITKLQKKNVEQEYRLKQQQNLYEDVRSDRNLRSKQLLEAEEEIAELKMQFKRMTQQINQLKDEISIKETAKQHADVLEAGMKKENIKLLNQKESLKKQINSSEEMIKTQDNDISRLKYVISEAEGEKLKQKKDYEMVINERDILGTQLIKRDEELSLLYEKIKIQKSTLKKGENYYQEKIDDIIQMVDIIRKTKRELNDAEMDTECIPDLKREIFLLEKEILEQQQKAKFLQDELAKPLNVHRWRKLESTDIDTYELIQKIQSLQKRLIAKTEEVSEKDVMIQKGEIVHRAEEHPR